jgi:hypothetical protein
MKRVIWKTSERIIPNFGIARAEEQILLPESLADRFIAQGEAAEIKTVTARKGAEVNDVRHDD